VYISLTGLKPKGFFAYIRFWFLAIPSFRQAQTALGNLHCDVKKMQEYQCTIPSWEDAYALLMGKGKFH
jgi:hypothetical protein